MKLISNRYQRCWHSVGTKLKKRGHREQPTTKKRELMKRRGRPFHHHTRLLYPAVTFLLVNPPHSNEKKKGVSRETGTLRIVAQRAYIVVCRVVVSPLTSFHHHRHNQHTHEESIHPFSRLSSVFVTNLIREWENACAAKTHRHTKACCALLTPVRDSLSLSCVPCDGINEPLITAQKIRRKTQPKLYTAIWLLCSSWAIKYAGSRFLSLLCLPREIFTRERNSSSIFFSSSGRDTGVVTLTGPDSIFCPPPFI